MTTVTSTTAPFGPTPKTQCGWTSKTFAALAFCLASTSHAVDFGPDGMFSITGFAKAEVMQVNNRCANCQVFPEENKQRLWADDLIPGAPYGKAESTVTLFQPWFGVKYDLGNGFKVNGLLSQRWRDGMVDIKGFWYERNIALSHENYGSVRIGAMTTRAWSLADFPYGTRLGVADVWASSGAGYGLMTNAIRLTSRPFDVLGGDLVLEATHDKGNQDFKINKPRFLELYAQYRKGDFTLEMMHQDSRNGNPQAWSHGPFTGLTPFPADDSKLGGSGQAIAMAIARYQMNSQVELTGGVRHNRWSGANAVITQAATPTQGALWNNMFNVNWNGSLNGVANPGYAVTTTDWLAGVRYKKGKWAASTGMVILGKGKTDNPMERGQSNSARVHTAGLSYDIENNFQVYAMAGLVEYARLGLAPVSMPGNAAFTNIDSRVTTTGNWFGVGAVYVF